MLVIVTARTPQREPHHAGAKRLHRVVQERPLVLEFLGGLAAIFGVSPETGRRQRRHHFWCVLFGSAPGDQFVTGNLLAQETVVRLVFVEGVDHIVAITPTTFDKPKNPRRIAVIAHQVRIANDIQPMPPPTFPEMRRGQQAINHTFIGLWRGIRKKGLGLLW